MKKNISVISSVAVTGLVAFSAPVFAQPTSAAASSRPATLEEVVVSARKTEEMLQTTPVAITALTPQTLERGQIKEVLDLQRATPGLSVAGGGTGPASLVYLAIRGNAQNVPTSAADAAVGIYVDGVYYGRPIIGNLGVLDLQSAEILRGPQGTLFGRNSTGGALQLTTNQPTDEFEGSLRAGIGNYALRVVESITNIPLKEDELAARIALRYNERGGYGSNPISGDDMGDITGEYFGRATLRWSPASLPAILTISVDHTKFDSHGNMTGLVGINPNGLLAAAYPDSSPYLQTSHNFYKSYGLPATGFSRIDESANFNRASGALANLEVELGDVQLRSITAYRESRSTNNDDLDGTPAPVGSFYSLYDNHQFSEELQLSGEADDLDWIGGLYYFKEAGFEQSDSVVLANATLGPGFVVNLAPPRRDYSDFDATSKGVYGQLNYQLTDDLRTTVGLRYTWDTRNINRQGTLNFSDAPYPVFNPGTFGIDLVQPDTCAVGANAGVVNPADGCDDAHSAKFKYPAWTFGFDYRLTADVFVYAKTSGAAMAGGFNVRPAPAGLDSFKPERVRDIEAGFKGDFLDHRLRTNLAVFYARRKGVQNMVNGFVAGQLSQYVRNAGEVESYGPEFEGTFLPWDGMELSTAISYLHSRYMPGSFVVEGLGGPLDRSGELVQQAPKWTASLGATQTIAMSWGEMVLHADYAYVSKRAYYQETADTTMPGLTAAERQALIDTSAIANQLGELDGYGIVNAQITANFSGTGVELALWGRNLLDKQYNQNVFNGYSSLGFVQQYQGAPRTYGLNATYRW